MRKYKKFTIPLPLYSEEYKQETGWSDRGQDRTVQWLCEVLDWAMEEFDLDVTDVFESLQSLQYMCFTKNDVRMSDYMNDLIQHTKTCMLSELPQKGEKPKHTILTDFYSDKLTDWYDEVCEWYQVLEVPKEDEPPEEVPEVSKEDESPGEVPEVSKVTKLEGVKRVKRKSDS